jgi:hypothetical protein
VSLSKIELDNSLIIGIDVELEALATGGGWKNVPSDTTLDFLAIIDPSEAPKYLMTDQVRVCCTDQATIAWLKEALKHDMPRFEPDPPEQHSLVIMQTPIGILCGIPSGQDSRECGQGPPTTEILIFGTRCGLMEYNDGNDREGFRNCVELDEYGEDSRYGPMVLYAVCLSSHLIHKNKEFDYEAEESSLITDRDGRDEPLVTEMIGNDRARLSQLFDEATERRKRPRLASARERSDSRASSVMTSPMLPQDGFSIDSLSPAPLLAPAKTTVGAQLNRRISGTTSSITIGTSGEQRPVGRRSNLERTSTLLSQSFTADTALEQQIEARNKEVISKLVLAGMKTYGLTSYKSGSKARSRSSLGGGDDSQLVQSPSMIMDGETQETANDARDAEYKNVYHQTVKGTNFTFRKAMGSMMLRQESVKEVVDNFLTMFCSEPT